MSQKPNIKTYTFIDGELSMDINVSLEEHNVYMNQTEIGIGLKNFIAKAQIMRIN